MQVTQASTHEEIVAVLEQSFLYPPEDLDAYHELRELEFSPWEAWRHVAITRGRKVGCNRCPVMKRELRRSEYRKRKCLAERAAAKAGGKAGR